MQFSFTSFISVALVAFAAGYLLSSARETQSFIKQQQELLAYQMVTLNGTPYRFNMETSQLARCSPQKGKNGNFTKMTCKNGR